MDEANFLKNLQGYNLSSNNIKYPALATKKQKMEIFENRRVQKKKIKISCLYSVSNCENDLGLKFIALFCC